jgi:hypothetical protein
VKLVREHINEKFTEDSDPIADMKIGAIQQIHKWFESVGEERSKRYNVDSNLNIIFNGSLDLQAMNVAELPKNNIMTVTGYLDLSNTKITELPDNLRVGGYLNLRGTKIKKLPENLTVGGNLYLEGTSIVKLPRSLKVKGEIYKV